MALRMPHVGRLILHRLVRPAVSGPGHIHIPVRFITNRSRRAFSTEGDKCPSDEEDKPSPPTAKMSYSEAAATRRRRPLSTVQRISSLLPEDVLSPEVMLLTEHHQQPQEQQGTSDVLAAQTLEEDSRGVDAGQEASPHVCHTSDGTEAQNAASQGSALLPRERLLAYGEILVAEYRKKGHVEYRKMFQLQTGDRLQSSWGVVLHDDIAGRPAGCHLNTHRGIPILVRRASLDDFVLYMRRGPTIVYPKDAGAMLTMMDVTEGDCVLECGSGSGAMSLFLSRAVGSSGSVLSVEVRADHHKRAVLNYNRWRTSWRVRRGEEWPDNVQFHNSDLCSASPLLAGQGFNAVALDMVNPQLVLPTVIPHLHPGAVCVVYLANITQVIDLLEGLRCLPSLSLLCERIVDVSIRDWLLAPAVHKDGRYCSRKLPLMAESQRENAADEEEPPAFGCVPYIARPHPEQMSHTAFLVKLRKCVQ